ncbi:MAG: FCD domain-containing protein [Mycobacterium sp.]|nr:FCD domain-containing protein [Mycobacterium sp.]
METGATRLAAERRRTVDISALHKLLAGMGDALDTALTEQSAQHTTDFQTLDTAFHMGIAQAAQNDRLLDAVADARRRMWLPVGAIFGRLEPNANDYHEAILEAIENREPELAAARMEAHITDTRHTIEAWLKR